MAIAITVIGIPVPQGSKTIRTNLSTGGAYIHESNRETLGPWRATVAAEAHRHIDERCPLTGPVRLSVVFTFPRPRSHYRAGRHQHELKPGAPVYCATRPDLDKLLRAIGDALVAGGVLRDDSSIAELVARKRYGSPAAHIVVRELAT